ncbi:MAG: SDR family oxidoreductase [Sphingomonadaceae bacterium]|nr:SDR family oxidoreductase [Sphingomonadaceae bacterium]
MDLGIAGRKAIICGSSRGLGRACAEALGEAGCTILINGLDPERLEGVAAEMRERFGAERVLHVAADVTTEAGRAALLAAMPEPDILITNANGPPAADFRMLDDEALHVGLTKNMTSPIALVQAVVDGMAARGFGRIINITSYSVLTPVDGLELSSGARAGLTAFLASIARQVAGNGVTINHLLPGPFETDRMTQLGEMMAKAKGVTVEQVRAEFLRPIPAGRMGTPAEFGAACAFLASAHAGFITGQGLLLDGGGFRSNF